MEKYMEEDNNIIKNKIKSVIDSSTDMNVVLNNLGDILQTLKAMENADEIILVCDASIVCANKIKKSEMTAQFYLMKCKAEMSKPAMIIHEMRNLTLALGWFSHALKSEKDNYENLDKQVNDAWSRVQLYMNRGFEYLKENPYVGPTAYCCQIAGEVFGTLYLQLKLYHMGSGRPWKSKIANLKIIRFLNLDDIFLLNKSSRNRVTEVKKECLRYLNEAVKYFKQEKDWKFLADTYLTLAVEHHSFNSPIKSKIARFKAKQLIKNHKMLELEQRLISTQSLPLIGSDRD